ncbi:MAG: ATP-binding protein [Gammaproteobacteria bacterium]|nr:ATP-binding protein [Gammaproteobacteria bacterium]
MNINGTCIASTTDEHGPIYVYQTRSSRILSFDGKIQQSRMRLDDINGLSHSYTQAMMTGLFFIPTIKIATITGLGAGSMAKNLISSFSELNVHAIEYREAVANTAKKYFHLPESDRLTIHIDDALHYMKNTGIKSDIIFSDLYNTAGMEPKQVQSAYLHDCKNALNEHGVLVLNIWQQALQSREDLEELLALVFGNSLLSFEVETGNIIVLAFKKNIPAIKNKALLDRGKYFQEKMNIPLERYAKLLWNKQQYKFGTE